jgi:hypothetical protein
MPIEERQYCGKFAAILPNVCHLHGRTIAGNYYENVHERQTWKMEQYKKHLASLSLWKNCGKQLMLQKDKNEYIFQ